MADEVDIKVVGLRDLIDQFDKLGRSFSHEELLPFELVGKAMFEAVREKTHVETGKLRLSGRHDTHYAGDEWSVEIKFAARPGIFELARGDEPTANHPEGGHFFFNAVEPFLPQIEQNMEELFRKAFGGPAI